MIYFQFKTIRTSTGFNICTANFTLLAIEHFFWTILFFGRLGRFIFPDLWQIYHKYNLSWVPFLVIFGALQLEFYGVCGTTKSSFIAMICVFFLQLFRIGFAFYFVIGRIPGSANVLFAILYFLWISFRLTIHAEILDRLAKGLKRKQCYEKI